MELEWTSTPTVERRETRGGVRVTEKWLELNAKNDSEICNFAMALANVLTSQLGYDPEEEEEHWFKVSAPNGVPSPEGCMKYFEERADEVLSVLWSLEPTAFDIFNYVKTEEHMEYDYGDGDDKYASALFPVDENRKKNKKRVKEDICDMAGEPSAEDWEQDNLVRLKFVQPALEKVKREHPELDGYIKDIESFWCFGGPLDHYSIEYFEKWILEDAIREKDQERRSQIAQKTADRKSRWTAKYDLSIGVTPERKELRRKASKAQSEVTYCQNKIKELQGELERWENYLPELQKAADEAWEACGGREFWSKYKVPKMPKEFESRKGNKKRVEERRKVVMDFADEEEAEEFKEEMKQRYHYPKVNSKYQVVTGKGKTGKSVVVEEQEMIKDPVDLLIKEGCVIIK